MKRIHRILSALICIALLIPTLATTVLAAVPAGSRAATPSAPAELDALSSYLHASESTEDNTSHLPVNVHTYYDDNKEYTPNTIGVDGSVIILYVMNTNTERLGTKSDAELVQSFLDRGYFVIVLDYMNNPAATGTALDWSVQDIRCQVIGGNCFAGGKVYTSGTYTDGKLVGENTSCSKSYILPAGYDIAYNIPYFSYDKHGVAGTFELIVEIWNNDFRSVKRNTIIKWVDENGMPNLELTDALTEKAPQDTKNINYATWFKTADGKNGISQSELIALSVAEQKQYQYTYVGNTYVKEVTDCVKPDGSMIDLTLYFDILYPSDYYEELPVMVSMSSSYTRAASWTGETRPYLNGPLFNGYVGVVSDYGLVPMCRNDHYGYFCGDSQLNSVSGDNGTYSLSYYNGIHSDTALLRTLRKIGVEGMDVEGYGFVSAPINPEKIGAYGNSKGGVIVRLANPTPEQLAEIRVAEGHVGETRLEAYEGNYPYVDPYIVNGGTTDERIAMPEVQPVLTYSNGQTIHSGLNFVFANCGGASNTLVEGSAPIFGVGTQAGGTEGSYYTFYTKTANYARNLDIPFFGLVAPKIAHDLGYGLDKDYGLDIYESFNKYANYWLKDDSAECIIVDVDTTQDIWVAADVPIDNVYEITEDSSIKLQFTGPIDESEIEKVKIISLSTGTELSGDWYGSYGDQQWKFIPYDIEDATYYTVIVPDSIVSKNGQPLKAGVSHTFRTASGVTETALSVKTLIDSFDCVSRGPTVARAGYSVNSDYKITSYNNEGFQIDTRAITSAVKKDNDVQLSIFEKIWADRSYIGKTVTFSFEAKATDEGMIELALNKRQKYAFANYPGFSGTADLNTEWQTFTFEFTVTAEMYDIIDNTANGIDAPGLSLGIHFYDFSDDGKVYRPAQLTFRNFNVLVPAEERSLSKTDEPLYFGFADADYSDANDITLRFGVTNNAANMVGIYAADNYSLGEKLGEVIVTGAGVYNVDVTDYIKSCEGAPVVAIKIENAVGSDIVNNFNYESDATGQIYFNSISKAIVTDEIKNSDGSANNSVKYEYMVNNSRYIDLDNNIVSKHIYSLSSFASSSGAIRIGSFQESDMGRRFRVSFRVYDETSRVISVATGYGYNIENFINDYKGDNYSFYTTAGEWKTFTFEFTVDSEIMLGDLLQKQVLIFEAENKSMAVLDDKAAVNVNGMASPTTNRPGNYAGQSGLNPEYDAYKTVEDAVAAGRVTVYDEFCYALYLDDLVVEEVATTVDIASTAPMLSITPTTSVDYLPDIFGSGLSTSPDQAQDGLWISGGKDGFDTNSVKSYVKISLEEYYGGYAGLVFNAVSESNANIYVYGVADVTSGQNWSNKTINSSNAPANDIYGSGVNLNAVFGNAPIASFKIGSVDQTCVVDCSEFATEMLEKGATEITLIIVSDSNSVTTINVIGSDAQALIKIAEYDAVNVKPGYAGAGFTLDVSTYAFYNNTSEGIMIDLRTAHKDTVKSTSNSRFDIFNEIWADRSYIGKTIRFSFSAKATESGSIELALNQRPKYAFANFPGFAETAALTTEWNTYTYEFVVTEEMYTIITGGDDGIVSPGLSLGVHFVGFDDGTGKYKGAQLTFRDFVVYEVPENTSEVVTRIVSYDGINTRPIQGGAGFSKLDESTYSFYIKNSEGMGVDLRTAYNDTVKTTSNTKFEIFNEVWADRSYIGKTIRFSFAAKASENGSIEIGLNQRQLYAFNTFPGFSGTASLTSSWKTFTYEFVVTEEMYTIITSGSDENGIQSPGLALGVHFNGFNDGTGKYKGAQIMFRNFVVSTVEYKESDEEALLRKYNFSTTTPGVTASGYSGSNLWAATDGSLEFYAGKITNGNANQNFRISVFDDVLGTHTENIGKTYRVIFKAKATTPGRVDLSLNTGTGGAGNPAKPNGAFDIYPEHTWAFNLTDEYETYNFTFVALAGMYDTASYATIQLGVRLFNGFHNGTSYIDSTVSFDEIIVVEDPYIRTVDINYDFETSKPAATDFDFRGYSTQIGSISNGALEIDLGNHTNAANSGQYSRIAAFKSIWANPANAGKTFTITFRAKAQEAGVMDFAINKTGTWDNYTYNGNGYTMKCNLTTEYQTFTFTFTAVSDMFTTNSATQLDCALRFYNGFRNSEGNYKDVSIYIDDVHVYQELDITKTTLAVSDSVAVSGSGNFDTLTVYADNSTSRVPEIVKTYLSYDLTDVDTTYGATLGIDLVNANGVNIKVYIIPDATLQSPVTYANAPVPTGAPVASFIAVNGMNYIDVSDAIANSVGKNIVVILTIEEPSDNVQIAATPVLELVQYYHNYTSDSQKHPAVAPTYTTPGNVEFYSCEGCEKLYVKNGDEFVEVTVDDVIIPVLVCDEHNYVNAICTICGRKEAHKCAGGTATCSAKAVCEICGQEYGSLDLNAHAWDDGVATKDPTCTEKGIMTFTCQNDSTHTRTEEIAALGHKYDAVVTAPDCENGGYTTYTCSVCGDSYVADQVGPLGHTNATPVVENNANPDCENVGGYDIVVYCSVCGDEVSRVHTEVPALGHNYNAVVTAPDCENGGYTTYTCTVCGDSYIADATDAIGHSYKSTVIAPDCENSGYTTYVCLVCGDTYVGDEVAALGHTEAIIPGKAPTCTKTGLTDGIRCTVCDKILTEQTEIPASGHIDNDKDYMCDVCGEDLCTDHEIEIIPAKAPTCTATGLTEGTKCAICGDIILAQNVVTALGHSYNAVVTAPDCENGGYTTYTCSVCGDSYVADEVAAIGHTNGAPVVENNVNPDCVNSGSYDTVIYCTVCGDEVSRVNTFVPALGHTYGTPVVENNVNPDCVNGGGYDVAIYCTVCNDEVSRVHTDVAALGHNYNAIVTAPTCIVGGYTTYTCSVCGDCYVGDEVAALGHSYDAVVTAPTCVAAGYTTYTCTGCGDSYVGDEVAALGHSYDAVVTAPTCVAAGYTTYTCTGCGDSYVGDEVAALGHDWEEATTEAPKTCKVCGETEGDKLPENVPETDITPDTDPSEEVNHAECKAPNQWEEFLTLLINFFRQLFGLPPKCYCGEEL